MGYCGFNQDILKRRRCCHVIWELFVSLGHSMAPAHRHTSGRSLVLSLLCLQIIYLQVTSGKFEDKVFWCECVYVYIQIIRKQYGWWAVSIFMCYVMSQHEWSARNIRWFGVWGVSVNDCGCSAPLLLRWVGKQPVPTPTNQYLIPGRASRERWVERVRWWGVVVAWSPCRERARVRACLTLVYPVVPRPPDSPTRRATSLSGSRASRVYLSPVRATFSS